MKLGHNLDGIDLYLPFGKSQAEHKTIEELPDYYLRWLLEQGWFESKYGEHIEPIQNLLKWRYDMGIKVDD